MGKSRTFASQAWRERIGGLFGGTTALRRFADDYGPAAVVAMLVVTAAIYSFSNYTVFADSDLKAYLFPARNWWNIVSIPPDAATNGATCRFTLTSDAALPSDIGAAMVSCVTDTTYEIGHSSAVPNHLFLPRVKALQERVGRGGYPFVLAKEAEVVTFPSHWDGAVLEFEVRCDRPVEDIRGMTMGIGRVQKEIAVLTTGTNTYALRSEWDSKALSEPFTRVELRDSKRKRCSPTVLAVRVRPVVRLDGIQVVRSGIYTFWRIPAGKSALEAMGQPGEEQSLEAGGRLTGNPGDRIVGLSRKGR